jgi:hypothetical protein
MSMLQVAAALRANLSQPTIAAIITDLGQQLYGPEPKQSVKELYDALVHPLESKPSE